MLWGALAALFIGAEWVKEKTEPRIPAENWRNRKLYDKDHLDPSVSPEQLMKNVKNGKYWMSDEAYEAYQKSEFTYKLSKPVVKTEWDYVLVGMTSYTPDKIEFCFKRACKSLDKYGKVELSKNDTTGSEFVNAKIRAGYNEIIQRIKDRYNGKIFIQKKKDTDSIIIELKEV